MCLNWQILLLLDFKIFSLIFEEDDTNTLSDISVNYHPDTLKLCMCIQCHEYILGIFFTQIALREVRNFELLSHFPTDAMSESECPNTLMFAVYTNCTSSLVPVVVLFAGFSTIFCDIYTSC